MKNNISPEDIWNEFWRSLCTKEDGTIDFEQIKKELADYSFILDQIPSIYSEVTGGSLSKPMYHAKGVIQQYEAHVRTIVNERFDEVIEELEKELEDTDESFDEYINGIKNAIDIIKNYR